MRETAPLTGPPDSYWDPDGGARKGKRGVGGVSKFPPSRVLGAEKRRATVFIPRAAFGGHLSLAWFELFLLFQKIQKNQSPISLSSSSLAAVGLLLLLDDDNEEEEEEEVVVVEAAAE